MSTNTVTSPTFTFPTHMFKFNLSRLFPDDPSNTDGTTDNPNEILTEASHKDEPATYDKHTKYTHDEIFKTTEYSKMITLITRRLSLHKSVTIKYHEEVPLKRTSERARDASMSILRDVVFRFANGDSKLYNEVVTDNYINNTGLGDNLIYMNLELTFSR